MLLDEELASAMQRLDILVLYVFDRHKPPVWATNRFTEGGGIMGIVLVTLTGGDDALGTDEAHVMPQGQVRREEAARLLRELDVPLAGDHGLR